MASAATARRNGSTSAFSAETRALLFRGAFAHKNNVDVHKKKQEKHEKTDAPPYDALRATCSYRIGWFRAAGAEGAAAAPSAALVASRRPAHAAWATAKHCSVKRTWCACVRWREKRKRYVFVPVIEGQN